MTKCGLVAVIGRPNQGKSTLVNHFVGQKLCITADKPQTTRYQVQGICTRDRVQLIFVDTPGLNKLTKKALARQLNREAWQALTEVDVIVQVCAGKTWQDEDQWIYDQAKLSEKPIFIVLNKVDKVKDKDRLLPSLARIQQQTDCETIIPLSAWTGDNTAALWDKLVQVIPSAPFKFSIDDMTNKSERFLVAELMREQLVRYLGDELPYATTVGVEKFEEQATCTRIALVIWIDKPSQKAIIIGKQGQQLKQLASRAREHMEQLLERTVYLQVWVKIKKAWMDDEAFIQRMQP